MVHKRSRARFPGPDGLRSDHAGPGCPGPDHQGVGPTVERDRHDPALDHLARQVDLALADVRRSEHVTPATQLALLVGGVPMILLLTAIAIRMIS